MVNQYGGSGLATLDPETFSRPSSRIGNAQNARSLVQRLKTEDDTRMWRYTSIMGLLDGNPPWSSQKLIDIGQGHRANFNLREGEGMVEAAKTPYYDLVFEVPFFARIEFGIEGADPTKLREWSQTATELYNDLLCEWSSFDQVMQLHQWQMVVNGVGPIFWPHYVSWQSEAVKSRRVLVPMETKANVDQLELCAVLHSYRADELESYIARSGNNNGDSDGWNVPLCQQAIIDSAMRETRATWAGENYDIYQRAIRAGDLYYGLHQSERIHVASLFIKEFGGKVSHYMVTDVPLNSVAAAQPINDPSEETGYLFKRRRKYDSFGQIVCPFFFDTGPDGTWHTVRGLGPKIYDFCDVSNRTFCQMLDGSVIGSGICLEAQEGVALEETQMALVGGGTVVSPGYKVVQTRIAESLQGAMAMRRELQNTLQSNTGAYRQRVEEQNQENTLGQAQLNYQTQATLTKGSVNRYYNNYDKWHRETVRRVMDPAQSKNVPGGTEAIEFMARCVFKGIPPQVLKFENIKRIYATRSIGYGSQQLRDMATRELIQLVPFMDEVSRNHALRARAAALPGIGMAQVDEFFPPIEQTGVPNSHTAFAALENNALRREKGKAIVEPQQNHSIHFDTHFADTQEHAKDPQAHITEQLNHFEQAGPHLAQHLKFLEGDPTRKQEVKQKTAQLQQLGKQTDRLRQMVEDWAKAQQDERSQAEAQQQPDMKGMAELAKVHGELGLKSQKMTGELELKKRAAAFKETIADKKTAAQIRREGARSAAEQRRKNVETGASIRRSGAEAAHSIARENVVAQSDLMREAMQPPPQGAP